MGHRAPGGCGTQPPHLGIEVPNDPDGGLWRTDPRSWSTGHPGDHAAARLVGPVPRDRVTPPCCGRGGVTRSFSCRSAGGGTAPAAALATQVTDQRRLRWSGGGQSWHGRLFRNGCAIRSVGQQPESRFMQAEPCTAARSAAAGLYCRGEPGPAGAASATPAGLVRFDPNVGGHPAGMPSLSGPPGGSGAGWVFIRRRSLGPFRRLPPGCAAFPGSGRCRGSR
jgi:hypothetical protein